MRTVGLAVLLCAPLLAQKTDLPRHLFSLSGPLTSQSSLPARTVAEDYLRGVASQYGLGAEDMAGLYVAREYRTDHNGVTHVLFKQQFAGIDVLNAAWAVNIDADGSVINAGGRLFRAPAADVAPPDMNSANQAVRAAVMEVNPKLAGRYLPFQTEAAAGSKGPRFARGAFGADIDSATVWYGVNGKLRPAWVFRIVDGDGIASYATVVDSENQKVLAKQSLTYYQAPPRGLVFERGSPQPDVTPGVLSTTPPPMVQRTLQPFAGDPMASPKGWVSGTGTAGNNAVVGSNPLGYDCTGGLNCLYPPATTAAANGDFSFPLEIGPDAPTPNTFTDAANVNIFYWVNQAHDLFYAIGFDEAAGNFQQQNYGRGGVEGDPMYVYSEFGSASQDGNSELNNSASGSLQAGVDGSKSAILVFMNTAQSSSGAGYFLDNAYDAAVLIHEYTHGVSHRLVDQIDYSFQAGAMGEAWSDFYALEFVTPEGAPADGSYAVGEFSFQMFGQGIRSRPYSTNTGVNPLTYANLGHVYTMPEVHVDGEIWMEALWEARANLIKQFGEKEGRRRARLLVLDGMKLCPPAPSMVDARDAILLADRVDFKGASQSQLWAAFAKRGLGILAQSGNSAYSVHVAPSFETPSPAGSLRFYEDRYVIGETVRVVLQDANVTGASVSIRLTGSSGDLETLQLNRDSGASVFTGTIETVYAPVFKGDGVVELVPGDDISAYYVDADSGAGPRLASITAPTYPDYSFLIASQSFTFGKETALGLKSGSRLYKLPFDFPFFGKTYRAVRVYNYGLLTFDLPDFSPCADLASLAMDTAIAPMFMNLATDGYAQSGEDVYVSRNSDESITFRWAAETAPDYPGSSPEPVNFAATLYQDGRIEYRYGKGNRNLVTGSNVNSYGCSAGSPTVGLSNGHETFAQVAFTHDGKGTLENASTVVFEPGFSYRGGPVGTLDSPEPDAHVPGVVTGSGIVYDVEKIIRRVDVLVDGIAVTRATLNVARPDFCSGQQVNGCPNVGFTFDVNPSLLGFAPGEHRLQLRATNTRGAIATFPETPMRFYVDETQGRLPYGQVETVSEGDGISGTKTIAGYALADDLRISAVDILLDGIVYGRATYNVIRNDVCSALSTKPPNCPRVGFTFELNTANGAIPVPNGPHKLQVRVLDEASRFTLIPEAPLDITVNNELNPLPVAVLSSPVLNEHLNGTVHFSGYAYSPAGKITQVVLEIDGTGYAYMTYGSARPEACAQLKDAAACPAIGFDLDFDTRIIPNGPHTVSVRVRDSAGASFDTAGPNGFGRNIFIEN